MTFNQYLEQDYTALIDACNKITGNNELALDLLHYAIEEIAQKENLQTILDSGGARYYLIRIMITQWRSQTGPFYRQFIKNHQDIGDFDGQVPETEEVDIDKIAGLIENLDWYDKELFKLYVDGDHNYSTLSKETGIPRTSIALTIKRVRKHIKKNL